MGKRNRGGGGGGGTPPAPDISNDPSFMARAGSIFVGGIASGFGSDLFARSPGLQGLLGTSSDAFTQALGQAGIATVGALAQLPVEQALSIVRGLPLVNELPFLAEDGIDDFFAGISEAYRKSGGKLTEGDVRAAGERMGDKTRARLESTQKTYAGALMKLLPLQVTAIDDWEARLSEEDKLKYAAYKSVLTADAIRLMLLRPDEDRIPFLSRMFPDVKPKKKGDPTGAAAVVSKITKEVEEGLAAAEKALGLEDKPVDPEEKKKREDAEKKAETRREKLGKNLGDEGAPKGVGGFFRKLFGG